MKVIELNKVVNDYNKGEQKEKSVFDFYGYEWKKDNLAYDKFSDLSINNIHISIKSSHFTLTEKLKVNEKNEQAFNKLINEYFANVHSNTFIYVCDNYKGYIMNVNEFKKFLLLFSRLEVTDNKQYKIRGKRCEKTIIKYLENEMI